MELKRNLDQIIEMAVVKQCGGISLLIDSHSDYKLCFIGRSEKYKQDGNKMETRMNNEYESLRHEISEWQGRRFTILTASITLVSGAIGFDVVQHDVSNVSWSMITSLL